MKTNPIFQQIIEGSIASRNDAIASREPLARAHKSLFETQVKMIKELRIALMICTLLFVLVPLSAQSFEKINGLGKRYSYVIDTLTNTQIQLQETTFEGHQMANYFSNEFGLVGYVFKKGKCFKMVLPIESVHTYNLTGLKVYEGQIYYKGHSKKVTVVENL